MSLNTLTLTSVTLLPPIEEEKDLSEQIDEVSDASSLSSQRLTRGPDTYLPHAFANACSLSLLFVSCRANSP